MMFVTSVFLIATVAAPPNALPEPVEAPSIRPTAEFEHVMAEAQAILDKRRPEAVKSIAGLLDHMKERGHAVEVPPNVAKNVPVGEITSLDEDGAEFKEGVQVKYMMKGTVAINEETVNRYAIETLIVTRDAESKVERGGSWSMSVATRVKKTKIGSGGHSAFKVGRYERLYIVGARCLKTGDVFVLDAARVMFAVAPRDE